MNTSSSIINPCRQIKEKWEVRNNNAATQKLNKDDYFINTFMWNFWGDVKYAFFLEFGI